MINLLETFDFSQLHSEGEWRFLLSSLNTCFHKKENSLEEWDFRRLFTQMFSFSIPTIEAIENIKSFVGSDPVVEYMSGSGYWAYFMSQAGINIIPSDIPIVYEDKNNEYYNSNIKRKNFIPLEEKDINKIPVSDFFGNKTVMFSWIPYDEDIANRVLEEMSLGQKLIVIGEGYGGCTGSDCFNDILNRQFTLVGEANIPQFEGIHDSISFYTKNNNDSKDKEAKKSDWYKTAQNTNSQEYMYHSTFSDRVPSIASQGLLPSEESHWSGEFDKFSLGKIFFATSPERSLYYSSIIFKARVENDGRVSFPILLRIHSSLFDFIKDSDSPECDYYLTEPVPPGNIEIYWHEQWQPISNIIDERGESIIDENLEYYIEENGLLTDGEGEEYESPLDAFQEVRDLYKNAQKSWYKTAQLRPWEIPKSDFLGNPTITTNENSKDLKPKFHNCNKDVEPENFMGYSIYRGSYGDNGEYKQYDVLDGDKPIASYDGNTLVVDKAYRGMGIGSELVYDFRTKNTEVLPANARTKKSQHIQEKVYKRIIDEALRNGEEIPPEVLSEYFSSNNNWYKTALTINQDTDNQEETEEIEEDIRPEFFKTMHPDLLNEDGTPKVVYHGTPRPDRIQNKFHKTRSVAGPMAYFTDSPDIASNYAESKSDSSLEEPEDYADWFIVKPDKRKKGVNVSQYWYSLDRQEQQRLIDVLPHIVLDPETDEVSYNPNEYGLTSKDHWDYILKSHKGNMLEAAKDLWLDSGSLFNQEEVFLKILGTAGIKNVNFNNPQSTYPAVYPVYLGITNPLDTSNIPPEVFEKLKQVAKRQRYVEPEIWSTWEKEKVNPQQWISDLEEEIAKGSGFTWTRIPEWATRTLKSFGYDGIKDSGNKKGLDTKSDHTVWIPFNPNQIKSSTGNKGTYDTTKKNILDGKGTMLVV